MARLSMSAKKWMVLLHILFASIMLGSTVVVLILSITALNTKSREVLQSCYTVMHLLSRTSMRASTIGTTLTGIVLSVTTHWGLFRYYWIILKEALTVLAIGTGVVGFYFWTLNGVTVVSAEGLGAVHHTDFMVNEVRLWVGIVLQLLSLAVMFAVSVFKPWGKRNDDIHSPGAPQKRK
ncbi:hypothetical protein ACFQI7_17565 [Paenibacillus allorhizosphaerae]|uniref:DUF2269 family protein n=1 Tax=Paenibacillus allorhizosphaerae TaxID=2849866 RepID=A0ABM8VEM3_9BACL|nr:hypothetical protein [Paenibacillus allorhizosphaerae]CAG7631906.1 hypothetical protein PAECIP111802_01793 [Paenibacillus allorhizosphaerae]